MWTNCLALNITLHFLSYVRLANSTIGQPLPMWSINDFVFTKSLSYTTLSKLFNLHLHI